MTEKDRKPEGGFRLDKYLADMKAGSRSEVKVMIRKGRVSVNGVIVCDAGYKVLKNDAVLLDGKSFEYTSVEYIMLNKPAGILSATKDKKQKTVLDLVCDARRKDLFPVGRLDRDTEGLLLLTNDGALAHRLLSPKKHVDKVYFARVYGKVTECEVLKFQQGLLLKQDLFSESGKEFFSLPAKLEILGFQADTSKEDIDLTENEHKFNEPDRGISEVRLTIQEGKFHQVKRMFEAVGMKVLYLKRLSMGNLLLDETLAPGEYRSLTEAEIKALFDCAFCGLPVSEKER